LGEERDYARNPAKLYFRQSELHILSKVCLYAKKVFFTKKAYDLCDEFSSAFKETNKRYYIYRRNSELDGEPSWVLNSIHESRGYVLAEEGVNRRGVLYNNHGHKVIKLKSHGKPVRMTQ
jgi:hypothetical protein